MAKTYSELARLQTFKERYEYLKQTTANRVGDSIFGYDRYLNQQFYTSAEWKRARDVVLSRDNGCDLGVEGYEIFDMPVIHHINNITKEDLEGEGSSLCDPENLICVSRGTHNAIHFGDENWLPKGIVERQKGDTRLW